MELRNWLNKKCSYYPEDDEEDGETMLDLIQKEQEGQNDPHEVTKKVVPEDDENDDNPMQLKMREIMSNPGKIKKSQEICSFFDLFGLKVKDLIVEIL